MTDYTWKKKLTSEPLSQASRLKETNSSMDLHLIQNMFSIIKSFSNEYQTMQFRIANESAKIFILGS